MQLHIFIFLQPLIYDHAGQRGDHFFLCIDGTGQSYKTSMYHLGLFVPFVVIFPIIVEYKMWILYGIIDVTFVNVK